jgi:hypothetical protein
VGKNYLEAFDYQLIKALDSRRRRRRSVGTIGFFPRRQSVLKGVFTLHPILVYIKKQRKKY